VGGFLFGAADVGGEDAAVFDGEVAADIDGVDVALGGGEDEVGVGVFEDGAEALGVDEEEVGELVGFEGAEFVFDVEDVGGAHGVEVEDVVGAHDGGGFVLVADGVEAGAHVFEGVGEIGGGFAVDAHADAEAELAIFGDVGGAGGEAAVGERVPGHGGVGFGSGVEDGVVGVDEVAEDEMWAELGAEEATVDEPGEEGALRGDGVRRFEVVALIADVEVAHEGGFHDGLLGRVVEGGHAADHYGEEARVGWLGSGPVVEGFETGAGLGGGGAGADAIGRVAVHEADAGGCLGAELGLFELVGGGGAVVGEVVGGGDAVLEVIERAEEAEPVEVVGRGFAGALAVEVVEPAGEGAGGGETAIGSLPEMRVCGDEAGDYPVAVGVDGGGGVEGCGRRAGSDGEDGAVGGDGEVAIDGSALVGRHGEDARVSDEEL